ncbi:hypothetical protein SAMN05443432_101231 [Roseovarius litoreus]|uniref:ParB-like nuclease domain-containing protein n=1 Tax=Roseovarius litoreus TaxID=1155722 RepID=A0A1M6ZYY8_9RHOB|nr:hypothetical protein [Roseovarius litoreus]SHL35543.1 hypothetical protein SAMN05443432_101231 [Roseovarius litoreus]
MDVSFFPVAELKHIEGFSQKRVDWLTQKILDEGVWTKPLALDDEHGLVLDGQHRMEAALALNLKRVPVVRFIYADVPLRSLRPNNHTFTWETVVDRALSGDIYPYKTVKHDFSDPLPQININLEDLRT